MTQRMVTGDARLGQPLHRIQHLHSTVSTVIYSIYLQYSAMMDSEALRVRLFVAQSRLRHSQGSDWYISLDIFVLENTKNQAYALRIPALQCTVSQSFTVTWTEPFIQIYTNLAKIFYQI